jgi:dienelactone hydrolase
VISKQKPDPFQWAYHSPEAWEQEGGSAKEVPVGDMVTLDVDGRETTAYDFLGHFAEYDRWGAHAEKVQAMEERLSASAGSVEFHTYSGTRHWFFESDHQESYHKDATEEAWRRTLDFLGARLA